jgi:glyoxylase-like metal-dependent hydrolase (beta-lactamase superfamily II)
VSGTIRDLAERGWSGAVPAGELWKPTGRAEEIAPGVIFLHTFANITVVRTSAGLVLIDTSNYAAREKTFALVRSVSDAPVFAAIYTHGHADHALGLPPFLAQAREQRWPRPRIVGHRNVAARFARYRQTNGYNALINARQFGIAPVWPMDYDDPDVVYDDRHTLTAGEVALELRHARGETDDHTWVWWHERRILWTGDQFIWVAPNAGNPQKVQRYAGDWAASLRAMRALEPELLIPGHGPPIFGAARIRQALGDTAEWL